MATKSIKKNKEQSTVEMLKSKVSNLNKVALNTSSEIVDETLATGEQWQNLMAKTLKKGTKLFGKQQDLVLTGLEMIKDQYSYGNKRFRKLLTSKTVGSPKTKSTEGTTKKSAASKKSMKQLKEAATPAAKAVKKTVKAAVKKSAPTKAPKQIKDGASTKPAPPTVNPTKLTLIEGIGPKIQELLNSAGIVNFDQLAETKPADLKKILTDAGTRFQMHDPSTWAAQAKLAAAGKLEELDVLKAELKAGK